MDQYLIIDDDELVYEHADSETLFDDLKAIVAAHATRGVDLSTLHVYRRTDIKPQPVQVAIDWGEEGQRLRAAVSRKDADK